MRNIYTHFFLNTGYVLLGNSGSKIISVLMLPLYTRWLSIEEFGLVDLLQIYSALLIVIVGACIVDAIFVLQIKMVKNRQAISPVAFVLSV